MRIAVVVLAGGQGSRIGGGKPLKLLGGQRLIDRAEALAWNWSDIRAVAVRNPDQVGNTRLTTIADDREIEGPLGGLAAALRFGSARGCEAVLTIPADMPFLPPALPSRLADELGTAGAALAGSGDRLHPVCGLWTVAALDRLDAYRASGQRSLIGFAQAIGYHSVWWPDHPADPFFNINSEQDLASAERLLG